MDITEIIKAAADNSIALVLALVVIYWNRKDAKEHISQEREDKLLMVKTLQENTAILTELKTLVRRLNGKG
jgi:hypothetical protein